MKKYSVILIVFLIFIAGFFLLKSPHNHSENLKAITNASGEIMHYTCSMHPSVKVSPKDYKNGNTTCPICFMPLLAVKKEIRQPVSDNTISHQKSITLSKQDVLVANIQTSTIIRTNLYKEIRAFGQVAYDPKLVIAQEEFVATLKTLNQTPSGNSKNRLAQLINASKRKLQLLGMTHHQILKLEKTKMADSQLIFPNNSVWIYADIYEKDRQWIKEGQEVSIYLHTIANKPFTGKVMAIKPNVQEKNRTLKTRILATIPKELASYIHPKSYVDVTIKSHLGNVLAVPKTAVLNTGQKYLVYTTKNDQQFIATEVLIGPEAVYYHGEHKIKAHPIIDGLFENQRVVTKGNFLIDSQRQIGAAASAYGGALGEEAATPTTHQH
jgi:multidrug efflux pump subunit AcrA (membrane-fusion protein)